MIPSPRRSPLATLFEERHDAYRERLRGVMAGFADQIEEWEEAGHVDPALFAELGAAGCFAERWVEGRVQGLPFMLALAEETALISGGVSLALTLHGEIFLGALERLAAEGEQRELLERARLGEAIGCLASTEPTGGSDLLGLRTTVERRDGGWLVRGAKRYTSNAGIATHALVVGHDPSLPRGRNLTLVVVPLDADGVEVVGFFGKVGINACDAAHLRFDTVLPDSAVLGKPGAGMFYVSPLLQHERVTLSAGLLAVARGCLELTVAFARGREIGGERLMDKQALRHALADSTTALLAGDALLSAVVSAYRDGRDVSQETAALKLYCATRVGEIIDRCLQTFGGRGYTENYPLERFWRDARLARIGGGADEVMRETIAGGIDRPSATFDALVAQLDEHDEAWLDRRVPEEV